jgi:hypothetical protein
MTHTATRGQDLRLACPRGWGCSSFSPHYRTTPSTSGLKSASPTQLGNSAPSPGRGQAHTTLTEKKKTKRQTTMTRTWTPTHPLHLDRTPSARACLRGKRSLPFPLRPLWAEPWGPASRCFFVHSPPALLSSTQSSRKPDDTTHRRASASTRDSLRGGLHLHLHPRRLRIAGTGPEPVTGGQVVPPIFPRDRYWAAADARQQAGTRSWGRTNLHPHISPQPFPLPRPLSLAIVSIPTSFSRPRSPPTPRAVFAVSSTYTRSAPE